MPYRSSWPVNPERELAEPEPTEPLFSEPIEAVEARIAKTVGKPKLYRDLDTTHPLVRHVLEEDEKRRTKPKGIPYRLQWADPLFDSPFERRRLRLLNSLFLAFAKAGHKCWLSDEEARSTGVYIGSQHVGFLLDHPSAKQDRDYRYRVRGGRVDTLKLKLSGPEKVWIDSATTKLESQLTEIVVQVITAGEVQLRRNEMHTYKSALKHRQEMADLLSKQREEAKRLAHERRLKAERERRSGLLRMARDLQRATEIRLLIERVQFSHGSDAGAQKWAAWASQVADRTDPLKRLRFTDAGDALLDQPELPDPET